MYTNSNKKDVYIAREVNKKDVYIAREVCLSPNSLLTCTEYIQNYRTLWHDAVCKLLSLLVFLLCKVSIFLVV